MVDTFHTIIIGAGPAGLNAARHLKEDCLLLDKKRHLGRPIQCGEGISHHALEREGIPIRSDWIRSEIRQIRRTMPNGRCWGEKREAPYAVVLDRTAFEENLAEGIDADIRLGSRVVGLERESGRWIVTTSDGERFSSVYLIGADGPMSPVARTIFGYTYSRVPGINYHVTLEKPLPTDELSMFFGEQIAPRGYGWVFPTGRFTANVGLLIKAQGRLRSYYRRFLDGILRPLYGAYEMGEQKSGMMPVSGFPERVAESNALLVGDAGAFTDPIFSGGIGLALLTGRLAAESINAGSCDLYQQAIDDLPFTGAALVRAQEIFYSFDDETLNQIGEALDGRSTRYISTDEGREDFMGRPAIRARVTDILEFAETWRSAKEFLW